MTNLKFNYLKSIFIQKIRRKIVRTKLNAFVQSETSRDFVLDLGCGASRYSKYFPNRVGLDLVRGQNVNIIADAHDLPIKSASFSVVFTTEMLEHTQNPQAVIDEIQRVLRPGGTLLLTTRFVFPIHEAPYDYFRFTIYGLKHLLRSWNNVDIQSDTGVFETIASLFQRVAYQSSLKGGKVTSTLCFIIAYFLTFGDWLLHKQYGNFNRTVIVDSIMASGYMVRARKPLAEE